MTKFCIHCGAEHDKRGLYCKPECHAEHRKAVRDERASKKCRLCGRNGTRPRTPAEWREFRKWQREQKRLEGVLPSGHKIPEIQQPSGV